MDFHWHELKEPVVIALGLPRPVLHVLFGALSFGCFFWVFRGSRHALLLAWSAAFLLQLVNEAGDAHDWIGWTGGINYADTVADTVVTMALPTAAVVAGLLRYRPQDS